MGYARAPLRARSGQRKLTGQTVSLLMREADSPIRLEQPDRTRLSGKRAI
ncbi:hypothetical protein BOSEA31B_13645 [Hyphomicrobiales bacterium]|nr:hypothetical protein BOSEA31B_13645 [Hyphomicrobiales bacterium]CAH1699416.1 hypothetical protein BOSEA1005_12469 [Hyphomicrobiales bacterium]CAI0343204.1 hypothetical protein BO1005MUT1_220003 [Hyphomicrobiales bacterium]